MTGLFFARPEPPRGLLRIAGADRVTFLQGLVSNDVRLVAAHAGIWSALLTPQGKYLHDFMILADGETLLLDADAARIDDFGQRLKRFRLRAAVEIADASSDLEVLYGWGEEAGLSFGLATPGAACRIGEALVLLDPRAPALGVRVVALPGAGEALLRDKGFQPGAWREWDRQRIRHGVPDGSRDLIVDKSILLENRFDELHGVAWDKGCYMGQELTARTKYRGLIKKRLVPVRLAAPVVAGTIVEKQDGGEAGEMRSAAGDLALALIRLDAMAVPLTAGDVAIEVLEPC